MTAFPVAASAAAAIAEDAPLARNEAEAAAVLGAPAVLTGAELPGAFASLADAERAHPGLYGDGRYEAYFRDGAWRVAVRHWRSGPERPVARDAAEAARKPLAYVRTEQEAIARLGAPVALIEETLPRRFRTHAQARAAHPAAFAGGFADIVQRDGRFAVQLTYFRPLDATPEGRVPPADRAAMAARQQAPLRGRRAQLPADVGLFEHPAPENDGIVLVEEEGDGRKPWE